ncbi:putative endonuclease [Pseudomonas phage gh-1]|uniref:Endonuclease I n=11 Tax=Ghunavirus TaxID=2732683 RepID=A0A1W6JRV0_9CAUD|nr:endonuclease [Pseudomonas phage gh-1]YP_009043246.1 endonuclease [Pseudomonas phage phiPSA2]YP_009784764.1 endonuclease [Pseudomonas phage phiPsa17]YP_009790455.1 endonuclease [Pseudomonas phage WRT]YP_009790505.1 endonuclease [Pseudomonas phage KNP]QHB47887.1 endonuclease I [Pseudomonas phage CHF1]QHB47934.1 endonuclease I [Pseudomonas phage CHF7]QHB47982.1 endonuclease I [Pseudomonas phage CHF19]QHB48030.1 endonuclease I [Pseudomonas phage CHF21]QHB48078.1 endonuclease I [Pseudomonas 
MAYAGPKGARTGAFRSGLEDRNAKHMDKLGVKYDFERFHINYVVPARDAKYTPDFVLANGIIIETKGIWEVDDRKKHLLIREQYPDLDIRLVFSNSNSKIYKGSPTSYADFCTKHGIQFADKLVPRDWLKEARKEIPQGVLVPKKGG